MSVEIHNVVFVVSMEMFANTFDLPPGTSVVFWRLLRLDPEAQEAIIDSTDPLTFPQGLPESVTKLVEPSVDQNGLRMSVTLQNQGTAAPLSFNYLINLSQEDPVLNRRITWPHDPSIVVLPDPTIPEP